jgi:hypothetical protein
MNKMQFFIDEVIVTDLNDKQKEIVKLLEEDKLHCVYGRLPNFSIMKFLTNCRDCNDKQWKMYCELKFQRLGPFDLAETFLNNE